MTNDLRIQAIHFQSIHLLQRDIIASVHLEDKEDELFCNSVLQKVKPGRYFFISHSRSGNHQDTTGCEQCLAYKPFLSKKFFVFIDSDMRYIMQETDIDAKHFICQTYTYSWENHYCESISLQHRYEAAFMSQRKEINFNFIQFLASLSKIVYRPLVVLYYCMKNKIQAFTITQLYKNIPTQCRGKELQDNGKKFLERIENNFNNIISSFQTQDFSKEEEELVALGIDETNAYLHIRGHNLFDMIAYIGKLLCKNTQISFYKDILTRDIPDSKYWEKENMYHDLEQIIL